MNAQSADEWVLPDTQPVDFLGLPLQPWTKTQFVEWVISRAKGTTPSTAFAINASSVNIAFQNRAYWTALQQCSAVYCDGISVLLGSKLLGRPVPQKLTTTDCLDPIAERCAAEGLSMYIVASGPGIARRAADNLVHNHRRLEIRGARSGYFQEGEEEEVLAEIAERRPAVLWVGMGNPVQELWVKKQQHRLHVPVTLTCGGMMEIIAGKLKRPPRWVTDNGFEWAFRLVNQPRHTWKRYLLGNAVFINRLALASVRGISSSAEEAPIGQGS